jgi:hypothetical protein
VALIFGHVFFGVNGVHRALGDTHGAVDALIGIDGEKVGAFAKAVHGADVDAIGVFALDAGFGDGMGHGVWWRSKTEKALLRQPVDFIGF